MKKGAMIKAPSSIGPLNPGERKTLSKLEATIEKNLSAFYELGVALKQIRMEHVDVKEIIGLRFQEDYKRAKGKESIAELVCRLCCTEQEWKDFLAAAFLEVTGAETKSPFLEGADLANAEATVGFVITEDSLSDMGDRWASEMVCDRCEKPLKTWRPISDSLKMITDGLEVAKGGVDAIRVAMAVGRELSPLESYRVSRSLKSTVDSVAYVIKYTKQVLEELMVGPRMPAEGGPPDLRS